MEIAKTVEQSRVAMAHLMLPEDANPYGSVHGGVVLKLIDTAAAMVAMRHTRMNVVTASIDRTDFRRPVYVGELATFKASINYVGRSSMEVGVRVEAENLATGEVRWTNTAYLTFVALGKDGKPARCPTLILETEDDHRRNREAERRRNLRLAEKQSERSRHD